MAISLTVFYIAIAASPDLVDAWIVRGSLVVIALLVLLRWRARSFPRKVEAREGRAVGISAGLVLVAMLTTRFLLPEGFSPWLILTGALPGLPFAILAWRVSRA